MARDRARGDSSAGLFMVRLAGTVLRLCMFLHVTFARSAT